METIKTHASPEIVPTAPAPRTEIRIGSIILSERGTYERTVQKGPRAIPQHIRRNDGQSDYAPHDVAEMIAAMQIGRPTA